MIIKIKLPNSISENTVISPDGDGWKIANSSNYFCCVLSTLDERGIIEGDDQNRYTVALFQGRTQARAAEAIPDVGGPIEVVNGEVRVGTASSIGYILPLTEGQPSRVAGDLVEICIR